MKKGDIYLADFGNSKKRPGLIFQTDKLNMAVEAGVCNSLCFLPKSALTEKLGSLNLQECTEVETVLKNLFDMLS